MGAIHSRKASDRLDRIPNRDRVQYLSLGYQSVRGRWASCPEGSRAGRYLPPPLDTGRDLPLRPASRHCRRPERGPHPSGRPCIPDTLIPRRRTRPSLGHSRRPRPGPRSRQLRSIANARCRSTALRPIILNATFCLTSAPLPFAPPRKFVHIGQGRSVAGRTSRSTSARPSSSPFSSLKR